MTIPKLILTLGCLIAIPLETKEAKVNPLFSKDLPEFPGKEGVMLLIEYPPGSVRTQSTATMHTVLFMCWKAPSSCRCGAERK